MPTLYLTCGLPGSGKTSVAKIIEHNASALRLTGDDWMHKLYPGISTPEAETGQSRSRVERLQWQIALRVISLECNVVIDWGVWSRAERDACRNEARALGARVVLCFQDIPFQELWNRLALRNAELPAGTFHITRADLLRWAELFEPPSAEEMALYDQPENPAINTLR